VIYEQCLNKTFCQIPSLTQRPHPCNH